MPRPSFITNEDLERWSVEFDKLDELYRDSAIIKEVCFAGLYLSEQLELLNCPDELIVRIQFTAGKLSYGHDPWEIHNSILTDYKNNQLTFDLEPSIAN